MKTIKGITLITTLIFMQILAILGIGALQMALLETKQSQYIWRKHETERLSENALRNIEHTLMTNNVSSCLIPEMPLTHLIANLPISPSCTGNFQTFQYYYAVESLGTDPCAYIQLSPKKTIANYFRITLLGIMNDVKVVLQTTQVISADGSPTDCKNVSHAVTEGRQTWREVNL